MALTPSPRPRRNLYDILRGLPEDEMPRRPAPMEPPSLAAKQPIEPISQPGELEQVANAPIRTRRQGIFDRIGDFINSDEGRAALLRSGAATMQGGLGAGVMAGAEFMDQRRSQGEENRRFDLMQALRERGVDIDEFQAESADARGWGGLGIQQGELEERGRSNRTREQLEARGQDVQRYGIDTRANVDVRGQDNQRVMNSEDNSTSRRGQDLGYQANIYDTNMDYRAERDRLTVPGSSDRPTRTVRRTTPGRPAVDGWLSDTPAVPEVVETIETPLAPAAAVVQPQASALTVGQIVAGYRYKGGDPNQQSSWERVA